MTHYRIDTYPGRKPTYVIADAKTRKIFCNAFSNMATAQHIVLCLNLYEELKEKNLLDTVLQQLNEG